MIFQGLLVIITPLLENNSNGASSASGSSLHAVPAGSRVIHTSPPTSSLSQLDAEVRCILTFIAFRSDSTVHEEPPATPDLHYVRLIS
ncbi:hypothetical protein M413DRAFT_442630 [Hebeloma cylindrosporum]|uniref:Uncharacterized protein n=1 Tax=Hebeloma cylindrosporum TaxID=76867 RepID=A0A0C2YUK6_HEBCY|nr:hypothetical protein M413DRAFT_442630 [Hebeloma cylindrosporum h7]